MTRTLIARLDSMGDVLLAGPAVRAVAGRADVVMLCGPRGAEAAKLLPGIDEILVWDAPWSGFPPPEVTPADTSRLVEAIVAAPIDEAVILTSFHQSPLPLALLLRLAGVRRITGASVDYPGSLLDVRLRPGEDLPERLPEPERALRIAAAAGYELPHDDDGLLRLRPLPAAPAFLANHPYAVLHPGADADARRWPAERFAETAALLHEAGIRPVVTGGPDERALTSAVADGAPDAVDLGGALDLPGLAAVLAGADVVVVGNTGPAHLAAAVGTPIVSLFSPVVDPECWAPYGTRVSLLGDQDAPCRATRARECPIPGHPCLASVSARAVVAEAERLARLARLAREDAAERDALAAGGERATETEEVHA